MIPQVHEKRTESRFTCACGARYAVFARSVFHDSKIVDFSDGGMRLKTNIPIDIGRTVMVQVTGPVADDGEKVDFRCPLNRTIGVGEVRWCEKSGVEAGAGYDLGVKIREI